MLIIVFLPFIVRYFDNGKKEKEELNSKLTEIGNKMDKLIELIEKD